MVVTLISEHIDTADEIFRTIFSSNIKNFKVGNKNFKRIYIFVDDSKYRDVQNWIDNAVNCDLIRSDSNIQH